MLNLCRTLFTQLFLVEPTMRDENSDHDAYYCYTGPARLDKAMHELEGIVQGIVADDKVNDREVAGLISWIGRHIEFAKHHPFNEVIPTLQTIVADGQVDDEERADLLWLCNKFSTEENYYNSVTSDMQRLQGVLAGVMADGTINETELSTLNSWLYAHEHLRSCWPYDEIDSLIASVMQDGRIDEAEHERLKLFFAEFMRTPARAAVGPQAGEVTLGGVCAVCPEIEFANQFFCFTGSSKRTSRNELSEIVVRLGGQFQPRLRNDTDYLIVGADGNPCWAYACYGRKVEDAVSPPPRRPATIDRSRERLLGRGWRLQLTLD